MKILELAKVSIDFFREFMGSKYLKDQLGNSCLRINETHGPTESIIYLEP